LVLDYLKHGGCFFRGCYEDKQALSENKFCNKNLIFNF
jgi:hypothetical protein